MYGRHFYDDKRRFGKTDELNLRSDEERAGRRGFYREKIAEIVNVHDSFAEARHRELHTVDFKRFHGSLLCFEIPYESDQIAIFVNVSAVGTRKRCQVVFNVHDVLHTQWERLVKW